MEDFKNTPVLSKLKVGEVAYYLKDAEARIKLAEEIAKLKSAAYREATDVVGEDNKLISGNALIAYVKNSLQDVAKAVVFRGVADTDPSLNGGTGDITIGSEPLVKKTGDLVLFGKKEFIFDGEKWVELGEEGIYLTQAQAAETYVAKTFTIAGIDMQDNITAEELKEKLGLKGLAYKDSVTATLTDYVNGITGAEYTPAGKVNVTLTQTSTKITSTGNVTATGNVTGTVTANGSVTLSETMSGDEGVQVTGSVAAPTVEVIPTTKQVQYIADVGTATKVKNAGEVIAPSVNEEKSRFATNGMIARLGVPDTDGEDVDTETLVIEAALTADALTTTNFNAGKTTLPVIEPGKIPTLGKQENVVTGITSATATAPVFTGGRIKANFTGASADIAAAFAGNSVEVSVSGNYDKATIDAEKTTFNGTQTTITPTLNKTSKSITAQ